MRTVKGIAVKEADVSLFVFYLILHRITWGGNKDMAWWLFLLMIPLYLSVRTFSENKNGLRLLTVSILIAVLVQTSWGILQLCGLLPSYHNAFRVTGSLFNPAPYAGFVAVGIPLAIGIFFSRDTCRWERALGCIVLLSTLVILPFTGSRAAWLAALAGGWHSLCLQQPWHYRCCPAGKATANGGKPTCCSVRALTLTRCARRGLYHYTNWLKFTMRPDVQLKLLHSQR